jgi:CspA family cold shock protein
MSDRIRGKVKWFNNDKGYGFINYGGDNVYTEKLAFVHYSHIYNYSKLPTLEEGEEVEFTAEYGNRGINAVDTVRLSDIDKYNEENRREKEPHNISSRCRILNYCNQFSIYSIEHIENAIKNKSLIEQGKYNILNGCPSSYGLDEYVGLCETEKEIKREAQRSQCERCWKKALGDVE